MGGNQNLQLTLLYFHWGKIFGIITCNGISLPFQIIPTDTLKECRPHSNINLVEFVWNYCYIMKRKMFAITAVPFDKDVHVLSLKHH